MDGYVGLVLVISSLFDWSRHLTGRKVGAFFLGWRQFGA